MIKITVKNAKIVQEFLKKVAVGFKNTASYAIAEYLVGDERHGLKHYPPYKHVSYKEAYPENAQFGGFFSKKQQGYVMSQIKKGNIDPGVSASNRYYGDAWTIERGDASRYVMKNDVGYAGYLVGDTQQSRLFELKGWRKVSQNIRDNWQGAMRHANQAIARLLKESK